MCGDRSWAPCLKRCFPLESGCPSPNPGCALETAFDLRDVVQIPFGGRPLEER